MKKLLMLFLLTTTLIFGKVEITKKPPTENMQLNFVKTKIPKKFKTLQEVQFTREKIAILDNYLIQIYLNNSITLIKFEDIKRIIFEDNSMYIKIEEENIKITDEHTQELIIQILNLKQEYIESHFKAE